MKIIRSYIYAFLFLPCILMAQEPEAFVDKYFLIIASTKDINEAKQIAKTASKKTGLEFHDSKLQSHKDGATFPADSCKKWGEEFPCYYARGRYDDGAYLSVEYSNQYEGFTKGLFVVMAVTGYNENDEFKVSVKNVKKQYPKSYVKKTKVYMGCMH